MTTSRQRTARPAGPDAGAAAPARLAAGSCQVPGAAARCAHGAGCHDGTEPAAATAPEGSRAWLLIEHAGPWPEQAADAVLPAPLKEAAQRAEALGIRVQLIRRPGRRRPRAAAGSDGSLPSVSVGWAAGSSPWLRRGNVADAGELAGQLAGLADGQAPAFGRPAGAPLFLVCAHGRRDVCCARLGGPLARVLAAHHPGRVWETTHVGGHRYAANLVILPHGLYYGPVDDDSAAAAIAAYERGEITSDRYRGQAGQPRDQQAASYARIRLAGSRAIGGDDGA